MVLRRILQAVLGSAAQPKHNAQQPYAAPFAYLDNLQRGLSARAERFLATGDDGQVLVDIDAATRAKLGFRPANYDSKAVIATNYLCFVLGGHPDRLARYAQLRYAMNWGISLRSAKGSEHLDAIPEIVRTLLVCSTYRHSVETDTPMTWEDLRAAIQILGGHDVDVITFCLPTERYTQRDINIKLGYQGTLYDQFDPASFVAALDRCNSKARASVFERLTKVPVVKAPEFLPYLFQQAHETSATLRKTAGALLAQHDDTVVTGLATEMLASKKAAARLFAVQALGTVASPSALDALKTHRKTEKSQNVLTTLELFTGGSTATVKAVENGYIDINGAHITLPAEIDLTDDGSSPLDDSFPALFHPVEEKMRQQAETDYTRSYEYWVRQDKKHTKPVKKEVYAVGPAWYAALNAPVVPKHSKDWKTAARMPYKHEDTVAPIIEAALDKIPLRRVIDLACSNAYNLASMLTRSNDPRDRYVQNAIADGRVSLAQVVGIAQQNGISEGNRRASEDGTSYAERYLTRTITHSGAYYGSEKIVPGIWQIAASHLTTLIENLPPRETDTKVILRALEVITDFPSLPQVLVQPLLFVAIDDRARLRDPAQKLLANAPDIDQQLIAILADKRQAVRASAARFLADRGATAALPALTKRLKTERSELARADLISAVSRLGGDTKPYLGRDALLKEAKAFTEKLSNAKLDWLPMSSAPRLQWVDGTAADPVLLDAWLRLALKLKSPLGSPLFGLYLTQMTPQSATAVADWVLDSWIAYDIDRPVGDTARAKAEKRAKDTVARGSSWMVSVGYTLEQMTEVFLKQMASGYPNSGTDTKGILALTHRATPAMAGPLIATYLKQHGRRVSQAKALVETLYGMDSQDAVQVLVATATRFKQRTVRELAETLVKELAEARGWTEDELADRSVPTGGFEDDGTLLLEVGEDAKPYLARLGSDLAVKLYNPQGKEVKSIPAGTDPNTKESKSLLSAAKKTIKTAQAQQLARLYGAMVNSRVWDRQAWQEDLTKHPIMQRLIERVIWRGLDDKGELITALRLTPEGEVLNAAGDDVDMGAISRIDIAHTANLPENDRQEWLDHLKDFEVKPLFPQVSRPMRTLTDSQKNDTRLTDREGWLMTTFKLRAAAKKAGYDRAPIGDGGGFDAYRKEFRGSHIWADLYFTGSYVSEDDIPAAIRHMQFTQMGENGHGRALTLGKVPPLLLSEVWNDLHELAKPGAFDEDWEQYGLY